MTSETRTITNVGTFTLSYDYNLAGELRKITDPTNMSINYAYDSVGRLSGVTGSDSLYANVSNYASNFQYRAWSGLKAMTDGKGYVSSLLYNSKLQPSHFEISGNTVTQNYDYYDDGRISVVHNTTDQNFDRSYSYDHVGRLKEAKSGANVNGYQYAPIPYHETFGYDGFSNLTARESQSWSGQTDDFDSAVYTNNRRSGWGYDADGRNTTIDTRTNTFDAVGQQTLMNAQKVLWNGNHVTVNQFSGYDGNGEKIQDVSSGVTTYYLGSSVLGGAIIDEINASGQKNVGYVYSPGGQLLATQQPNNPDMVTWKHNTPAGTSKYTMNTYIPAIGRTEFDPLGADLSLTAPEDPPPSEGNGDIGAGHFGGIMDARWSDFFNISGGCMIDGMAASCGLAMSAVNAGAAVIGPENTTRWNPNLNNGQGGYQFFHAWADGTQGWSPFNWVPGLSGSAAGSSGPPSLKNVSPEEAARRRAIVAEFGRSGFGDEDVELTSSPDPQNPGPTIAFGPNYQNLIQPFKDAFDEAVDRLKKKKDCAKLFGGLQNALNTLNSATYRLFNDPIKTTYKDGKFVPSVTGAMTASGNTVFINLAGPFFNGPDLKISGNRSFKADFGTGLKGTDLAALLLLHELGHEIGKWGSDAGVGDKDKNLEHTMAAYKACF